MTLLQNNWCVRLSLSIAAITAFATAWAQSHSSKAIKFVTLPEFSSPTRGIPDHLVTEIFMNVDALATPSMLRNVNTNTITALAKTNQSTGMKVE